MKAPPDDTSDGVTVNDYVKAVCGAYKLPADVVWSQTVADLQLMLSGAADQGGEDDEAAASKRAKSMEVAEGMKRMTVDDQIELAEWMTQLM
jgi:hypothetical protein